MSAVDTVESEVRELVRRRGLDPLSDRLAVRRLVDEVVSHYDERALTSSLAPLPDPLTAARSVYDAVAGFGPLQGHLDDNTIEEIWINGRLTGGFSSRVLGGASPEGPAQMGLRQGGRQSPHRLTGRGRSRSSGRCARRTIPVKPGSTVERPVIMTLS